MIEDGGGIVIGMASKPSPKPKSSSSSKSGSESLPSSGNGEGCNERSNGEARAGLVLMGDVERIFLVWVRRFSRGRIFFEGRCLMGSSCPGRISIDRGPKVLDTNLTRLAPLIDVALPTFPLDIDPSSPSCTGAYARLEFEDGV